MLEDIEQIREEEGIEDRSEAARQVLRRGLDSSQQSDAPGEQLTQLMTGVAAVGSVVAAIAGGVGQPWAMPLVVPFATTTVICSLLWASVRVLAGRDLV